MHVLIADALDEAGLAPLKAAGLDITIDPGLTADDLVAALPGCDVLVVRGTRVTAEAIRSADRLALVVRAGAGTDTIDTEAAASRGVYVCNLPGRNAIAVAELTMGLLMAIDRAIVDQVTDLRSGSWDKARYSKADGLFGKTIGIVGLGSIGLAVAERARAFGLVPIAIRKPDRSAVTEARIRSVGVRLVDDLDALLGAADIVSIHVPSNEETDGLVNADFLNRMKHGATLLNTSRGDTIVEHDLLAAIDARGLKVGLDVWPGEPAAKTGDFSSRLAQHPSVIGTHHVGAATEQAQRAVVDAATDLILDYSRGELSNCVNLETARLGCCALIVRHADKVGVLAQVLSVLREASINVQQMENRIFRGGAAAVAELNLHSVPDATVVESIRSIDEVFGATVKDLSQ